MPTEILEDTGIIADDPINEDESPHASEDEEPLEPYVDMSIREFIDDVQSDKHIRAMLDLPGGFAQDNHIAKYFSDGHLECSTTSHPGSNTDYESRFADIAKTSNWYLAHQSGFLTHGHADASGMGTIFAVQGHGAKLWLAMDYRPPAGEVLDRPKLMQGLKRLYFGVPRSAKHPEQTDDGAGRPDFSVDGGGTLRRAVIVLRQGDLVIQAPLKGHVVYTPVPTITAGQHYLNWGSLHLTEVDRSFEKLTDRRATNHDASVQLMLIYMAAALPSRVKEGGEFFKKPLIALCLMVLSPRKYIHADSIRDRVGKLNDEGVQQFLGRLRHPAGNWVRGPIDRQAQLVCLVVLRSLCPDAFPKRKKVRREDTSVPVLPDMAAIRDSYLFSQDGQDWQDPGPVIQLGQTLEKYVQWVPRPDDAVLGPLYDEAGQAASPDGRQVPQGASELHVANRTPYTY
ncbi:hypothetical protein HDZ31DRAFT_51061 [Schizophyllum fasciatum]